MRTARTAVPGWKKPSLTFDIGKWYQPPADDEDVDDGEFSTGTADTPAAVDAGDEALKAAKPKAANAAKAAPGRGHNSSIGPTEDAVGLRLAEEHEDKLRFDATANCWMKLGGGGIWAPDVKNYVLQMAREICREVANGGEERAKVKLGSVAFARGAEALARGDHRIAVTADCWDADPMLLGTPGGTVDLRTGVLRPGRGVDGITRSTAIAPAQTADCPRWLALVDHVADGDPATIRFLQMWIGYCLTGLTTEQALMFIFGPGGNGKSLFVAVLVAIFGTYAVTAAMDTFIAAQGERHSTDLAMLKGARFVTASETEANRPWAEARIKQLTGGDLITARKMRQDNSTYRPVFKLTFVGNHQPGLSTVDDAVRRRFMMVPFIRKPAAPDRQLEEKLRAEWAGILRWAIDGCLAWQAAGELVRPASVRAATDTFFENKDLLTDWLTERCVVDVRDASMLTTHKALFSSWLEFAEGLNEPVGTGKAFSTKLTAKVMLKPEKYIADPNGRRTRGFRGIRLIQPNYEMGVGV